MKPPLCFICLVSFLVLLLDLQKNSVYSIPNRNIETWMDSIYFCHGGGSSVPDSVAGGGSYCGEIKEPQRYTKVITTSLALQKFVLALAYGARASPLLCPWCWPSTEQSEGILSTPVCENNLARVQHTMHIKPQISPQWLCWLYKESHLSHLVETALFLSSLYSCDETCPGHLGMRSFSLLLWLLLLPLSQQCACTRLKQRPKRAAVLLSCSLPAFQQATLSLMPAVSAFGLQALGCWAMGNGEQLTVSQPLPPAQVNVTSCCYFPFLCSHWGALPCPQVCLPAFILNNNKARCQWPCANIPRQVPSFPGLCLLFQQLLLPQMLGLSCHFQPARSRKFVMLSMQCAKGSHLTEWPCHLSSLSKLLMKTGSLT